MSPLERFFQARIAKLRHIVREARGDLTLDDVKNEAWVLAAELELKGIRLNLDDAEDEDAFAGKLFGRLIKPRQTRIGFALRLDKDWDRESEDGPHLIEVIHDPNATDPLQLLEAKELLSPVEIACRESYSQATTYAVCLYHWPDEFSLAHYLCVTRATLQDRIRKSRFEVSVQSSLFDGIERIPLDFCPVEGRLFLTMELPEISIEQGALPF